MWPGFGDNIRVIDWMLRRCNNEDIGVPSPIGIIPKKGSINFEGLADVEEDELMSLPKDYWTEDIKETKQFLEDQVVAYFVYTEYNFNNSKIQTLFIKFIYFLK